VLATCVVATLAAGLVATVALGDEIRFVDETQYLAIGRSIADHGQIHLFGHPSAYRTPGWPAVIAVVDLLGGGRPVVRFLNFVFEAGRSPPCTRSPEPSPHGPPPRLPRC
jgi:hypothetical protein